MKNSDVHILSGGEIKDVQPGQISTEGPFLTDVTPPPDDFSDRIAELRELAKR